MKRFITVLFILAAAVVPLAAQTPVWSLEQCLKYASEHNSDVLLGKIGEEKSRQKLVQSELELLPTLSLNANQYYNWGRSVDMQELVIVRNRLTRQTSASVGASFAIFEGFARINTIAMNKALVKAAAEACRQTEFEVKADIAAAYLGNVLARITRERLSESYDNVRLQRERIESTVALGAVSKGDLLELEAKGADILSQIATAIGQENENMQQLKALMGCDRMFFTDTSAAAGGSAAPLCPQIDPTLPPPMVEAAVSEKEAASFALKAAKGALFPTLSLSAGYGTYYSDASEADFKDQLSGNGNPSVALNLSIPLFDGGKRLSAVARARSELRESEIKLRQARQKAAGYAEGLICQEDLLCRQCEIGREKCRLCRERLLQETARYQEGAITTSQWIDACESLSQSECELAQCICKYLFHLKIMEYYEDECRR